MIYSTEDLVTRTASLNLPEGDRIMIILLGQIRDLLTVLVGNHVACDHDDEPPGS